MTYQMSSVLLFIAQSVPPFALLVEPMHYGSKQFDSETSKIQWAKWASEQTNERSGVRKWSEQCRASKWVSGTSERANGQANGPVLTSRILLAYLNHRKSKPLYQSVTDAGPTGATGWRCAGLNVIVWDARGRFGREKCAISPASTYYGAKSSSFLAPKKNMAPHFRAKCFIAVVE